MQHPAQPDSQQFLVTWSESWSNVKVWNGRKNLSHFTKKWDTWTASLTWEKPNICPQVLIPAWISTDITGLWRLLSVQPDLSAGYGPEFVSTGLSGLLYLSGRPFSVGIELHCSAPRNFPFSFFSNWIFDGKCQREQDFLKVILCGARLWSYLMPAEMLLCIEKVIWTKITKFRFKLLKKLLKRDDRCYKHPFNI